MTTHRLFIDIKKYSIYREILLSSRGRDYKEIERRIKKKNGKRKEKKRKEKSNKYVKE